MVIHALHPVIARIAGVNAALIFNKIQHYVEYHRNEKTNFHDDLHWSYNTHEGFVKQFPYYTKRQIRTAIDKLIEHKLIVKGNYNKFKNDKTLWYSIHPEIGLTLKSHQESWTDFEVTSSYDFKVTSTYDLNDTPLPIKTSKDQYSNKEFELESEKRTSNPDEVFDKLWKHILGFIPKEKKSYFSKKISRERFYKIVKRKQHPISATRIANAVLWFYADDGQTKDDRKYMKALQYVLKDELFEIYLEKGAFTAKSSSGATMDDVWAQRGKIYLRHGWDHSWLSGHSRETPQQYWKYFPENDWETLGWRK